MAKKAIASPLLPEINTLLMITEKCGKDGDNHREREKNQDRHQELSALKVIQGWTPGGDALKKVSRSLC